MGIFNWLFRSKQVKDMLRALDELRPLFDSSGPRIAFNGIMQRLRAYIIEHPQEIRENLVRHGHQPRISCLVAMVRITRDDLASGHDHIYRGILSMVGESKKSIFEIAMQELEKATVCTAEVRRLRSQELEDAIAEVG
jgi:hypothetical protein